MSQCPSLRKRLSLVRCPSWSQPLGLGDKVTSSRHGHRQPPPQHRLDPGVGVGRRHFQERSVVGWCHTGMPQSLCTPWVSSVGPDGGQLCAGD